MAFLAARRPARSQAGLARLPRPLPRRCEDTGTPAHTHTHKTNSAFSARGLGAVPAVTGSDHGCLSPGFLRSGWSVRPGEATSRQRVPPAPLPRGRGTGAGTAGRGGRRPDPSGALPENGPGRSRESPRSGRAAVGAGAQPAPARPKEAQFAITYG